MLDRKLTWWWHFPAISYHWAINGHKVAINYYIIEYNCCKNTRINSGNNVIDGHLWARDLQNVSKQLCWIALMLPSAMAIMVIWPFLAVMAIMAMSDGNNNMAIMDIQWKSMEKLTHQCCFQLISTYHSKVMAIWTRVLKKKNIFLGWSPSRKIGENETNLNKFLPCESLSCMFHLHCSRVP